MSDATAPDALRDRIAQEIHLHCPARPHRCQCTGLADAVMPAVQADRTEQAERLAYAEDRLRKAEQAYRRLADRHADTEATRDRWQKRAEQAEAEVEKLQRRVSGYRGMKDVYLRERNAAHDELIEAENLIELLCNDREAGQGVAKAALTEQRERAEQAEAQNRQYDTAIAAERRGRLAAEAAVRRVREHHHRHDCTRHVSASTPVPCVNEGLCEGCAARHPCPTVAALDAEGQQDEALAAIEQARTLVDALIATIPEAGNLAIVQQVTHRTLRRVRAALDAAQPKEGT